MPVDGVAPKAAAVTRRACMSEEREIYTVEEAGAKLGLSRNSAYEAVRRGDIPCIRIGRRVLVPKKALARLLAGAGA